MSCTLYVKEEQKELKVLVFHYSKLTHELLLKVPPVHSSLILR